MLRRTGLLLAATVILCLPLLAAAGDEHSHCVTCSATGEYQAAYSTASVEKAKIDNGAVVFYSSDDPEVVALLHESAKEKSAMMDEISGWDESVISAKLCAMCQDHIEAMATVTVTIGFSDTGYFRVLTAEDEETVKVIHESLSL